jgi:Protein of unknown function (DUF3225)
MILSCAELSARLLHSTEERSVEIDIPEIKAEVEAAFQQYEHALVTNDVAVLDALFLNSDRTIRYGYGEIAAFRAARPSVGLQRVLERTVITTYGRDMATAWTLFRRVSSTGKVGRQSQVWMRTPDGWRVVAAHVSLIDEP